jgi:hypothetical protein
MTTFTSDDREEAYRKKVDEAPYHPGYEGAVVPPQPVYKGISPNKMLWKSKPLSDEEIIFIRDSCYVQSGIDEWEFDDVNFARAIEEAHGIK